MYRRKLTTEKEKERSRKGKEEGYALAELWVLTDKLLIPGLQSLALKVISAKETKTRLCPSWIFHYVCVNTTSGSGIYR